MDFSIWKNFFLLDKKKIPISDRIRISTYMQLWHFPQHTLMQLGADA